MNVPIPGAQQIAKRFQQVVDHIKPQNVAEAGWDRAGSILTAGQLVVFQELPDHDQAHLMCVMRNVERLGWVDRDLLQAALLHDIGKIADGRTPNLLDRTLFVLLNRVSPKVLCFLTRSQHWWNRGLYLAAHHPALGAERARSLGCSVRACDLIARHGQVARSDDALLRDLQSADRAC